MVDISTAIINNFFIVAPSLLSAAIKHVPDFSLLAVGNVNRAIRSLRHAIGARQRVGRTHQGILAREAAAKISNLPDGLPPANG
jgi:hypothetical protein